jgi:trimeric autotransporter adhesin
MDSMTELKNPTLFVIILMIVCFGVLSKARAVFPPPDGGYPNFNTAEGQNALFSLTTGAGNTGVGWLSLRTVTTGQFNTGIGAGSLALNTGDENTAVGAVALLRNSTGAGNTAMGFAALTNDTIGSPNTALGAKALYTCSNGIENTAVGYQALYTDNSDGDNTAVGHRALHDNTEGVFNTAVGANTLTLSTESFLNTAIGAGAGNAIRTATNVICLGAFVQGADVNNSCYIGNIWNQPGGSQAVYVNSDGKLGLQVSSARYKDEIKPIEGASEVIYALKPVSFRYKREIEPTRPRDFGLIAEEVDKASPDLVTRGSDGKVNSVRYDAVNAMLLNEFLKEHKNVQELKSSLVQQQKEIAALITHIKEQDAKIQRVSDQLENGKTAVRLATMR